MVDKHICTLFDYRHSNSVRNLMALVLVLSLTLAFFAASAFGQTPCADRTKTLEHLGKNHDETPAHRGVTANGRLLEVLKSKTGTWTIIVTRPDGVACMVATGQMWEDVEWLPKSDGA